MADYRYLAVERRGDVVTCAMSNPPRHTMVHEEAEELLRLFDVLERVNPPRVLVLTGGGEGIFVRHYEVGELSESADRLAAGDAPRLPPPEPGRRHVGLRGVMRRLEQMDAVTIAAVNGMAMGGGLELALACDFRLAMDGDFAIGLPETGVGILPGGGGTQRLPRLIGVAAALDLILHGAIVSPERALELGIVHRVFAPDAFEREVRAFADALASRAPRALANAKRAIREGIELPLEAGLRREEELFAELMRTEDAASALRAALSGERYTDWKGR